MSIACWITKATNTHSQYVIFIVIPLQQWLHERASILRCMYTDCLVKILFLTLEENKIATVKVKVKVKVKLKLKVKVKVQVKVKVKVQVNCTLEQASNAAEVPTALLFLFFGTRWS